MGVDLTLPAQELLDGKLIALASLLEREKAGTHAGNDLGLPPNDPAFRAGRRKIVE
jgi:hypothetical protein